MSVKPLNRRQIIIFLGIFFLLFLLPFLVKEAQKRQLFRKRAEVSGYFDEVPSQLPVDNLEFEDGILATEKEINIYLNDKKTKKPAVNEDIIKPKEVSKKESGVEEVPTAARTLGGIGSFTGGGGESSRLTLPSISAFSSNLQTGVAQITYPITTFPGLGGLTPSVSLVYSSSAVDDMRLYRKNPEYYTTQAGIAGLGWEIGGISYIARDTTTYPDSFHLVFAGGATRLFKLEGSSDWQSNPKLFMKVHHTPNNHYQYYDTNTWMITTQDGTQYIFGSPVKEDGSPLDEALTPLTLAKAHRGSCEDNDNPNTTKGTPYKWYLREVRDINGNTIIYEYDKDWASTYYGACEHRGFTTATYLKRIKYNYKNGSYQTTIDFNYEDRPDYKVWDWLRYHREECKSSGILSEEDCEKSAGMVQYKVARKRLKEIIVNVTGQLARKYVLSYELSPGRGTFGQGPNPREWHPGHSLLKEIRQYGFGDTQSLPPYTFSYNQIGDTNNPNNVYLTKANNGYGGEVSYEYTLVSPPFCTSDATCGGEGDFGSARFVVSKIITNDGEGNTFQKSYIYQNPKAYVETAIDTSQVDHCNQVWRSQCRTACEEAYPDNPDAQGRCKSRCDNAFCGYPAPFSGFEFLGFGQVTESLSALNNPGAIEASTRTFFHQAFEKQGCFEPDPRKGRAYKTEVLNPQGKVLTYNETFYDPDRTNESCRSDNKLWEKDSIFVKAVQTNNVQADPSVGNKVTATKTYYNDTYGLVTKVENLGEVRFSNPTNHRLIEDIPGDEVYSFTDYIVNNDKWIIKPKETWISDSSSGATKYKQTYYYYDGNDRYYPAPTKNLEKGLLTRTSLEDAKTYGSVKRIITNFEYYDNGQPKKTIDPMGYTTETFYDNKIGVFPVAIKNPLGQVSRTQYSDRDYVLGLPTISIDIAGRKTKTEYDTFGRVLNIFNPDDNDPTQSESQPSISYQYFDSLGKPYIRIKTKVFENNYQVVDKIYNGLGQLLQDQVLSTFVDVDETGNKQEKGLVTQTKYNSRGQKIEASLPVIVDKREPVAPPVKLALPAYEKTTTSYDQLGRVVAVVDPVGRTSRTEYLNFTTTTIDPAGHRAVSEVDGLGRVRNTFGYLGEFGQTSGKRINVASIYDVSGNPLQVVQSFPDNPELGQITTTSRYDLLGRKLEVNDPDLGKWTFEYDNKGRVIKQTDAKNQTIQFKYDELDRLTKKIYPKKPYTEAIRNYVEYKYDNQCKTGANSLGQRCQMDDLTGYTKWEYDKKGRVVKMTKFIDKNITGTSSDETANYEYTYFPTNQIKTYKYSDGEVLTYTYDKYGNQQTISGVQPYLTDTAVNKFGSPTKITLGEGFSQTFAYNNINQLTNLTARSADQTLFANDYTSYDFLGNILSITERRGNGQTETTNYTYDSLSQLKNAQVAGAATANYSYIYDEAGNMLTKTEDTTVNMTYSNTHPVHAPKTVNGFTYRYDANGNLLEDEERTYEWDFDNKPIRITLKASGKQVVFYYDGDGERVVKKEVNP